MKQAGPEAFMKIMGRFYETLCKIPAVGPSLARGYAGNLARVLYYMPGSGTSRQESLEGVKAYLLETGRRMHFPFEVIPDSEGPDSFEFYVHGCPYGFTRPDQAVPCDAAMEMDRVLFRLLGADLTIQESAVEGAPSCRIRLKWRG